MHVKRTLTICLLLGITFAAVGARANSLPAAEEEVFAYLPLILRSEPVVSTEELKIEQAVLQMLNELRVTNGLPVLSLSSELTQAARRHSKDMADSGFTGHTGSDGTSPGQRISEAGYDALYWGEIIGWGFGGDSDLMVAWWMNSPVHRSLILSSNFVDFGAGYKRDSSSVWEHYWTVTFGLRDLPDDLILEERWSVCKSSVVTQIGGSSLIFYSTDRCP